MICGFILPLVMGEVREFRVKAPVRYDLLTGDEPGAGGL
jgi:hypothetical protein